MKNFKFILEQFEKKITALTNENHTMKQTIVRLTTELEHTKQELKNHKQKIDELEQIPKGRIEVIYSAIISAIATGLITVIINSFFQ